VIFTFLGLVVALLAGNGKTGAPEAPQAATGWGSESIAVLQSGLSKVSPISLANACGMGASSCFKCHNGKRAGAPNMDETKAPWHTHHKKVNNSCVGCHKGNPRIMKEDMAHAQMSKSPKGGAESCGGCHKGDLAKVEEAYKSITSGSN
jgi:hypothetical protein